MIVDHQKMYQFVMSAVQSKEQILHCNFGLFQEFYCNFLLVKMGKLQIYNFDIRDVRMLPVLLPLQAEVAVWFVNLLLCSVRLGIFLLFPGDVHQTHCPTNTITRRLPAQWGRGFPLLLCSKSLRSTLTGTKLGLSLRRKI